MNRNNNYRNFFIFWAILWAFIDASIIITWSYQSTTLGFWSESKNVIGVVFDLFGVCLSLGLMIYLLLYFINANKSIRNYLKVANPVNFLVSGMVYFYARNFISVIKNILTTTGPEYIFSIITFHLMWIIPSIIVSIFHYSHYKHLLEYNSELAKGNVKKPDERKIENSVY